MFTLSQEVRLAGGKVHNCRRFSVQHASVDDGVEAILQISREHRWIFDGRFAASICAGRYKRPRPFDELA